MSYVYIQTETARETGSYPLYTVGFYKPDGRFEPESEHGGHFGREKAAARVAWLNGGRAVNEVLGEALNSGDGSYRP